MSIKPKLSLCMIVRDEELNLPKCLDSVRNVVDEIVIADTGSSDETITIARQYGAKVINVEWNDNFAEARNEALNDATCEWILHLDADEILTEDSANKILKMISEQEAQGFTIKVRSYQSQNDLVSYLDDAQIRLFKNNPEYRYELPVHEQIGNSIIRNGGKILPTDLIIEHFGYMNTPDLKADRNLPMLILALKDKPDDAYLNFKMGETLKALNRLEEAKSYFKKILKCNFKLLPAELVDILLMRMAQIELAEDNYPEVLKYCLEGLKINPGNIISMYVLSIALIYLGQIDKAYDYIIKIKKQNETAIIDPRDIDKLLVLCTTINPQLKV